MNIKKNELMNVIPYSYLQTIFATLLSLCLALAGSSCSNSENQKSNGTNKEINNNSFRTKQSNCHINTQHSGEAYITLENEDIIYMSDMLIFFLSKNFNKNYTTLFQERNQRLNDIVESVITDDDIADSEKEKTDAMREEIEIAKQGIQEQLNKARNELLNELEASISETETILQQNKNMIDEFNTITKPYIKKLEQTE